MIKLNSVLFWLALALALTLMALVLLAPWVENGAGVIGLFADDVAVRRSAVGAALGLLVTAFVFFRGSSEEDSKRRPRKPPPPRVVGA